MSIQTEYTKIKLGLSFLDVVKRINTNFDTVKANIAAKDEASGANPALANTVANLQKQADATDATVAANKTAAEKAISDAKTELNTEIAKKATKATTLAGYGITDAKIANGVITLGSNTITPITSLANYYTKTQVDTNISTAVDDAKEALRNGLVEITTSVPTTENAKSGIIYLVSVGDSEANNAYAEYVLATKSDGTKSIEKLGDLKLDLSAYAKTTDVNTALDKKVDKVTGKELSTNDYTTDEKNKLAGIAEGANKTVVDNALSSTSTNPVQNKVIINELEKIKELIKSSDSGTVDNSAIEALETALEQVRNSIPTKTSQLENDDYTVKDDSYVHTDNNLTDQRMENLDNLKEVTAVEFSSTSPYWSGNTLTLQLAEHQYFIALYRSSANGSVLDVSTPCRQKNQQVIIDASAPFSGHIMVSGTIAYGDLNELLGIILNESVVYTYTLEDILGEPYKEPVYPDKEQLASTVTALQNCVNSLKESGGEILTQCNDVKAGCKDYFDLITQRYMELENETTSFVKNGDFEEYKTSMATALDNYCDKAYADSIDNKLTSEKLKYVSMSDSDYKALTETLSDVMYITKDDTTAQNTIGAYINGQNILASGDSGSSSGDGGTASSFTIKALNANDDLNDYSDTGFYVCTKYKTAQTLKNLPAGFKTAFFMLILKNELNLQMLWHYEGKEMYIRSNDFYDDVDHWGSWYKFSGTLLSS